MDLIFNEFEKCFNVLNKIETEINYSKQVLEIIDDIEMSVKQNNIIKIEELINNINEFNIDKKLLDVLNRFLVLYKIFIKINNSFEQYDECLVKINSIKNEYQSNLKVNKEKCEELRGKIKILEYVDKIGLPIDNEGVINDIIDQCEKNSISPIYILKIIMDGNISVYNNHEISKKDDYLTVEKMNTLGIDEETQDSILEIKSLVKNVKSDGTDGIVNYILTIKDDDSLDEALDKYLFVCDENVILGVFKNLLDRIDVGEDVLDIFSSIYFKYLENSEKDSTSEIENGEKAKLIYLVKPTSDTPYIYEDIDRIESKVIRRCLKGQFKELVCGNTFGKPLTMAGMFEKKKYKVRITFTMLPNNYILIVSCYQKGINGISMTRERLNPSATAQIMLYKALINKDEQELERTINYITKSLRLSKKEIDNYISSFETMQDINILGYFEKGGDTK